jgi:hypothetical protein
MREYSFKSADEAFKVTVMGNKNAVARMYLSKFVLFKQPEIIYLMGTIHISAFGKSSARWRARPRVY